jgi:hypothetical protein
MSLGSEKESLDEGDTLGIDRRKERRGSLHRTQVGHNQARLALCREVGLNRHPTTNN